MTTVPKSVQGTAIDDSLVRALLESQAPQYLGLEVGDYYWHAEEHVTIRLGTTHVMRLPRERQHVGLYEESMRWLRAVSRDWDFTTLVPEYIGFPEFGFPYRWEISRWVDATDSLEAPLQGQAAAQLGLALRQIHQPAPSTAPFHPHTSVPLDSRTTLFSSHLARLVGGDGPGGIRVAPGDAMEVWKAACDTEVDLPRCWVHGYLDPRCVLSDHGNFAGLLEWRYLAQGDPATDLGYAILLGGPEHVEDFLEAYNHNVSDATLMRARGVSVERAVAYALSELADMRTLGWKRLNDLGLVNHPG